MTDRAAEADAWRILDNSAYAWFDAPSLTVGANMVVRMAEMAEGRAMPDVDLRPGGLRVRIGVPGVPGPTEADLERAHAISTAALELGLTADPAALQVIGLEFETADAASVLDFWRVALTYGSSGADSLQDPLRIHPAISFRRLDHVATLRNRVHVDVVGPPEAVDAIRTALDGEPYGVYGVTLADLEGNEVDVVPGDLLGAEGEAGDWRVVFSAMTFYSTDSPSQAGRLAAAAADLADRVEVPLVIDLRPEGVTIGSGKDLWEGEGQTAGAEFIDLAHRIQSAARDLGLSANPDRVRFVQLGIDVVDVPASRSFWVDMLGYRPDQRALVTDIFDPRRLNPVIIFQDLDPSEEDRRRQRDRIHVVLWVPEDHVQARIDAAVAAGGRVVADGEPGRCALSDPEGNELLIRWG